MSTEQIVSQLDNNLRTLSSRWNSTKPLWNDSVSAYFETSCINSIEQQTNRTLTKMQELTKILSEAQRRVR